MAIELEQRPEISAGDQERIEIDYSGWLGRGELLAGTPTAQEIGSEDLTISGAQINSATLEILGDEVAPYHAVVFSVAGQMAGKKYRVRVTASSDATPARVAVRDLIITVR